MIFPNRECPDLDHHSLVYAIIQEETTQELDLVLLVNDGLHGDLGRSDKMLGGSNLPASTLIFDVANR